MTAPDPDERCHNCGCQHRAHAELPVFDLGGARHPCEHCSCPNFTAQRTDESVQDAASMQDDFVMGENPGLGPAWAQHEPAPARLAVVKSLPEEHEHPSTYAEGGVISGPSMPSDDTVLVEISPGQGWVQHAPDPKAPCAVCGGIELHSPGCPSLGTPVVDRSTTGTRSSRICVEAANLITGDRHETYGDAADDFTRTGKIWAAILGLEEVTAEQVALCMAGVKIGRLCQTPSHRDSWVDGVGYFALGGGIASAPGRHE